MSTKLFSRLTRLARSFILLRSGNWKDCGGRKRADSTTDATRCYRQCDITVSTTANSVQSGLPRSWCRPWLKHCRTGQVAGAFLEKEGIPFLGLELDPGIVKEARLAGQPVFCADSSDQGVLENAGLEGADMLIVTHSDLSSALQTLRIVKSIRPDLKTIVRTTNDRLANQLRDAGATEVIPEALETGLLIASHLLLTLKVPDRKVARYLADQRRKRYPMLREIFRSDLDTLLDTDFDVEVLHSIRILDGDPAAGKTIAETLGEQQQVLASALVRDGVRLRKPPLDTVLKPGDVLVVLGPQNEIVALQLRMTSADEARTL